MKVKTCTEPNRMKQHKLENLICREFIEHDIMFLSDLLRNMSIDIECPFCTTLLEQLMAMRRDFKKELRGLRNAESRKEDILIPQSEFRNRKERRVV